MVKTSNWWDHNAKYVRAYSAYLLILLAFQTAAGLLHLRDRISSGLEVVGVPETVSLWVSSIAHWLTLMVLGFFIFRNAARKFVLLRQD